MRCAEAEEGSKKNETSQNEKNSSSLTLRDLASRSIRPINIGTAVLPKPLFEENLVDNTAGSNDKNKNLYEKTLSSEFNSIVIEHHLKWSPLCETLPGPHPELQPKYNQLGRYDFHQVDRMVDYAKSQNMTIKGHVLIWHVTSPKYLNQISDPTILRREMKRHINTVMGRYKDSINMWDVVNESLAPDGSFANNVFYRVLGESYIEEAFRMAHEADPTAFLIYNDNKVEGVESAKSEAFFQLLKKLVEKGVPVHGAGMQAHFNAAGVKLNRIPSPMSIRKQIRRIGELGLKVNISEMDVRVSKLPPPSSTTAISAIENKEIERNDLLKDITSADTFRSFVQYKIYRDVLIAALAEPAFDGIWFWGFTDKHTWVKHFYYDDHPLLFDEEYKKKASYYGVKEALEIVTASGTMLEMEYDNLDTWGHEWMQPEPESESNQDLTQTKDSKGNDKPDWQQS